MVLNKAHVEPEAKPNQRKLGPDLQMMPGSFETYSFDFSPEHLSLQTPRGCATTAMKTWATETTGNKVKMDILKVKVMRAIMVGTKVAAATKVTATKVKVGEVREARSSRQQERV